MSRRRIKLVRSPLLSHPTVVISTVLTRAAAGLPPGQQPRIVIRDLPPDAVTPEGGP